MPKLGQIGANDSIEFEKITVEDAERLYKIQNEEVSKKNISEIVIKEYSIGIIDSKYHVKLYKNDHKDSEDFQITVNGKYVEIEEVIDSFH